MGALGPVSVSGAERHRLDVELGERSYPIYIGRNLLSDPACYRPYIVGERVMIVSNETVAPLYLEALRAGLEGFEIDQVILPDGERYKDLTTLNRIFDALLERRCGRDVTIVALGGGVVGDMAGFAAACYQRGVPFIQVPTTLLAQVDSSVGGKTGVNHPAGKNMIGAFHQPRAVIADTATLETLPERELSAGLAEVIKYGLISDRLFFDWLEEKVPALRALDPVALATAIARSCQNKALIVAADERESGQRALLNLGHSFGHAIEAGTGYGTWLHGEAVGVGLVMAAQLSERLGWLKPVDTARIQDLVARAGLPIVPPDSMPSERWLELMAVDKKVQRGRLRLVLLQGIGAALLTADVDAGQLQATIADAQRPPRQTA
ncbi:3-dehydroquinate synthase [Lamprobacter modestohalophilus]|uniref:3-dehydroquinate synthase n=1 Tax=Lamprobacter modestohalophilus TaxID=1064514 RepID=UPI002ADEBAA9|nr:3-dehydroquinate synthase [Lamprobacter modestohalophilus]MEA1049351.1 3-dehydroquinate synthase [Lamprobacter modestohalophilus]